MRLVEPENSGPGPRFFECDLVRPFFCLPNLGDLTLKGPTNGKELDL